MASSPPPDPAPFSLGGRRVDFAHPLDISIELDPAGPQPRHFGAPRASATPYVAGSFNGSVVAGASCNCAVLTINAHCNGTHTEGVGHLTREPWPVNRVIPTLPLRARVVSVPLRRAKEVRGEDSDPKPHADDLLVTRQDLIASATDSWAAQALVIRTLPNAAAKKQRDYSDGTAAYLTRQAAQWLVSNSIEHVLLDLPSMDRSHDEGRLTAHRIFFGLPPGSQRLEEARRSRCTVTELAFIDDAIADGEYALFLQAPSIASDAVPSRPLLYPLLES